MKILKKAFTLIELLVVIAIIALLLSIVGPSYYKIKVHSLRVVCGNDIRQSKMALVMGADENDGEFTRQTLGDWLHDVAYATTDKIIELGGADKHTFYCPSTRKWDDGGDNPLYWQWSQSWPIAPDVYYGPEPDSNREYEYRVTGYFWMLEFEGGRGWEPEGQHTWLYKTTHYSDGEGNVGQSIRNAATVPMITDQIFTDDYYRDYRDCDFSGSMLGGLGTLYGIPDVTNHAEGDKVDGGNIGFLDCHVEWRQIKDMMRRNNWQPYHWW